MIKSLLRVTSACNASMNSLVLERAMVTKLFTRSALVNPMPRSIMEKVLLALMSMVAEMMVEAVATEVVVVVAAGIGVEDEQINAESQK